MADRASSTAPIDLRAVVEVREDRELANELARRATTASPTPTLGVTDLVSGRAAYWRRVGPAVPISRERLVARERGLWFHAALGRALAREGPIEVRLRRDGVAGRVDVLADRPTEVKTSSSPIDPARLFDSRPDHIEQLGMYCALLGKTTGRLLYLQVSERALESVRAVDVGFADADRLRTSLASRAAALRRALTDRTPAELPGCRWFGRGCEFENAGVCDCRGTEPSVDDGSLGRRPDLVDRPDVADRVRSALAPVQRSPAPPPIERFRDLIYPRRAYFERTTPLTVTDEAPPRPVTGDTFPRLLDVVEGGPVGEVAGLPVQTDETSEEVVAFRGEPVLLRTSRAWDPIDPASLVERSPQYVLDLGFRCVATGALGGRVILAYERARSDAERYAVFELRLRSRTPFSRLWRDRTSEVERALATGEPTSATACPSWMAPGCPYAAVCGCDPGLSHR